MDVREEIERFPRTPGVYLMRIRRGASSMLVRRKICATACGMYSRRMETHATTSVWVSLPWSISIFSPPTRKKTRSFLKIPSIKKHKPRFNINLRDEKTTSTSGLTPSNCIARLTVVRRPGKDKALYFGPYASAGGARDAPLLYRRFPYRS